MATTVDSAFSQFLENPVRLASERTKIARSSKSWLLDEIKKFPEDGVFPKLHPDLNIDYGSFSRRTKIRPLDDIDIMIILDAQGGTYNETSSIITIHNRNNAVQFNSLSNNESDQINSIKVVNKFRDYLSNIPQYKNATIKRNQEAVTLELLSYEWVYDIVPCFVTEPEVDGKTYYLIPDGKGNWKKTDPRIDKLRVDTITSKNEVSVIDVVRLFKYWNRRQTMPSMNSYLIENIILNYFDQGNHVRFVDIEFKDSLAYLANAVLSSVMDPKNIQGDLNNLSWDDRIKINQKALSDHSKAIEARVFEQENKMKESINKWREIFGSDFPTYTG